jgi:hypothetical protein
MTHKQEVRMDRVKTALKVFEGVKVIVKPGLPCRACGRSIPVVWDGRDSRWYQNLWMHKCGLRLGQQHETNLL